LKQYHDVQSQGTHFLEGNPDYPITSFANLEEIDDWVKTGYKSKPLILYGGAGLGKTEYIKSLLINRYGLNGLLISNREDFKNLTAETQYFICDDFNYSKISPQELIWLVDTKNVGSLRVLYSSVKFVEGLRRILIINSLERVVPAEWFQVEREAFFRRCEIYKVVNPIYLKCDQYIGVVVERADTLFAEKILLSHVEAESEPILTNYTATMYKLEQVADKLSTFCALLKEENTMKIPSKNLELASSLAKEILELKGLSYVNETILNGFITIQPTRNNWNKFPVLVESKLPVIDITPASEDPLSTDFMGGDQKEGPL
jgi:hypothetical protein